MLRVRDGVVTFAKGSPPHCSALTTKASRSHWVRSTPIPTILRDREDTPTIAKKHAPETSRSQETRISKFKHTRSLSKTHPSPSGSKSNMHKSKNIVWTRSRDQNTAITPRATNWTPKRMKFSKKLKNFHFNKRTSESRQINSLLHEILQTSHKYNDELMPSAGTRILAG